MTPADAVYLVQSAVGQIAIGWVVRLNRHSSADRVESQPLDQQRAVHAEHINPITEPIRTISQIDQYVIASAESRRHRIPFDPDHR
jgi:hypothetical protein